MVNDESHSARVLIGCNTYNINMCLRVLRDAFVSRATASDRALVRATWKTLLLRPLLLNLSSKFEKNLVKRPLGYEIDLDRCIFERYCKREGSG